MTIGSPRLRLVASRSKRTPIVATAMSAAIGLPGREDSASYQMNRYAMLQADAMAKAQSNHGTWRRDEVLKAGKVRKARKLANERWIKRTSLSLKMPQPTKNGSGDEAQRWNRAQARQPHNKMAAENPLDFLPPRSASWAWTSWSVLIISRDLSHENTSQRQDEEVPSYPP